MTDDQFRHLLANKIQSRDSRDTIQILTILKTVHHSLGDIIYKIQGGYSVNIMNSFILDWIKQLSLALFYIGRVDGRYNLASDEKDLENIVS